MLKSCGGVSSPRDLAMLPNCGSIATGSRSDATPPQLCGPSGRALMARMARPNASVSAMPYVDPIPALKQQIGAELAALLEGWNADDVAVMIGTDRPRISELRRGKLNRFSLETLIRYVTRLRRRVELVVTPASRIDRRR